MTLPTALLTLLVLTPALCMVVAAFLPQLRKPDLSDLWRGFTGLSLAAVVSSVLACFGGPQLTLLQPWLQPTTVGLVLAVLVQLLGTVIGLFSSRYLQGERGQRRYIAALAGVLAAVQLLLLADHWLILILAWALVGLALRYLLCFYPERPFAQLAVHKKQIADRLADLLLILAAVMAWRETGSGSLAELRDLIEQGTHAPGLQVTAICLVLAVLLRTALLPVHGWLIQVMEAPTPVSALLHAGVVNLGGFVLIRFAPLLEQVPAARWLLVIAGLVTALLAGMVLLTRISIKVRLAWSTVAQMGFMILECGLGLYTLAFLHLLGHSLYKAHAFLSASSIVRETRLQMMHAPERPGAFSLLLAPLVTVSIVALVHLVSGTSAWPWWWTAILGLAWAPLLWLPSTQGPEAPSLVKYALTGVATAAGLTTITLLAHAIPFGTHDSPDLDTGLAALAGMSLLYLSLVLLHLRPGLLAGWRRWSYAGFYVDEFYTRLALRLWPTAWAPESDRFQSAPASAAPVDKNR